MRAARWWTRSALVVLTAGGLVDIAGMPAWAEDAEQVAEQVAVAGRPVPSTRLFLRPTPSTKVAAVGMLRPGQPIGVACQVQGQRITDSSAGSSTTWDRLITGQYVSDVYVQWQDGRPAVPSCPASASASASASAQANTGPATPQEQFVAWVATFAKPLQAANGIPAAVTIAQAILESGWGRSQLTMQGKNFFGMKCFDGPGPLATGCRSYATSECDRTTCYSTRAAFRVYDTELASFEDHSRVLSSSPRYRAAFDQAGDADRFARAVAAAGYATSPTYARDLIGIMRTYDLYRFNEPG